MSRFQELYRLPYKKYQINSPVIILAAALQKDIQDDKVLVQVKIQNLSDICIVGCKVIVQAYEVNGSSLIETVEYSYLDLLVYRGEYFGVKEPIYVPSNTRIINVLVDEVVGKNGEVWRNDGRWIDVPKGEELVDNLDEESLEQYGIDVGGNAKYIPSVWEDLFLCTCGTINKRGTACSNCDRKFEFLNGAINRDILMQNYSERKEKERREEEQRLKDEAEREEQKRIQIEKEEAEKRVSNEIKAKKRRQIIKISLLSFLLVAIVGSLIKFVFIPLSEKQESYNYAESLFEAGDYDGAKNEFEKLDDYKDSVQKKEEADSLIETQYENINYKELMKMLEIRDREKFISLLGDDYVIEEGALNGEKEYVYYNVGGFGIGINKMIISCDPETEEVVDFIVYFDELSMQESTDLHSDFNSMYGDCIDRRQARHTASGYTSDGEHFMKKTTTYTYYWTVFDGNKLSYSETEEGIAQWFSREYK